ncbi:methyltransferase family protein [Sphaerotilus hippei]|uniref:Methyltransferase family protein n=1 Tax=Sphaerotilus hippei TaxID=744406 RepID=A0A318GY58_9BURK|nr:methyltransferase domain-containing protein [Sphaerotilus hippei]PXW94790.1 methyltransferase family protein [Sphaerotilus hippei]
MTLPDRHLDLGCGRCPRNPYGRRQLCGVDLQALDPADLPDPSIQYRVANLVLHPIPWPDHSFASVSAFDFIEHVPRLIVTPSGTSTLFPFVRLMDEVWRVLAPGGRFYAITPTYPSIEAFQDPTHVNIITERTHAYFCGEQPMARMYGFAGRFSVRRAEWVDPSQHTSARPDDSPPEPPEPVSWPRRCAHRIRDSLRRARGRPVRGPHAWFLWELEAVKPAALNDRDCNP